MKKEYKKPELEKHEGLQTVAVVCQIGGSGAGTDTYN